MPRNMSFALTTGQVRDQSKTVTRRFGWYFLKPGDLIQPVEKSMGLKQGEKIKKIGGLVRVVSIRKEPLMAIDQADCIKEGFPEYTPNTFVDMLQDHYGGDISPDSIINRIEFEYL